ncbi:MAG: translation initiation factor eIF-1A [Candidatus Thermoplasmatota archaeon]|nr:translation initiation factor eIF-1A [Candidatus Thermoplasmatota archaeon]MEC9394072.1 translation initiation factor eIF-1A [Candidatus Thermoplasmatota archaeon]
MARREERVDTELLARLESGTSDKIRVTLPNKKINEMFAIADQILGGRRVRAVCDDGESRLARIPGKMRRRQWVREGDLIIVQPWDFQDSRADVRMRYTKTQSIYLSRKGVLPEIVDLFGMSDDQLEEREDDYKVISSAVVEETPATEDAEEIEETAEEEVSEVKPSTSFADDDDDDIDSFFG